MKTRASTLQDRIARAVRAAYPLPADLARLRTHATADLYNGPQSNDPESAYFHGEEGYRFPGFSAACRQLRAWADDNLPRTLYWDDDAEYLSDSEPEGFKDDDGEWIEPSPYYAVDSRDILRAVFGRELAGYL